MLPPIKKEPIKAPSIYKEVPATLHSTAVQLVCLVRLLPRGELMALDDEITTQIIKHFTDRKVPILTVHDSYIVESSREQELMDVMQSVTREVVGNHKFKMKQQRLSPNMIQTFTNQDKQINAMDGYKSITSSITRTSGYITRYKAFQKYLEDYPLTWYQRPINE